MKQRKCKWCKDIIPVERVYAAKSRGSEALYCSDKCRNSANVAAYRERKKS